MVINIAGNNWLSTNIPEVFYDDSSFIDWVNGLSDIDILNLRMNVSGLRESFEDLRKDPPTSCSVLNRLITL